MKRHFWMLLLLLALVGCGKATPNMPLPQFEDPVNPIPILYGPVSNVRWFMAKNAYLRLTEDIGLHVEYMKSNIILKNPDLPFVAENVNSYRAIVHQGRAGLTADVLTKLMNNYVFASADSPLFNIKVSFAGNKIKMSGTMHKFGLNVNFEMTGAMSPTPDGMVLMTPVEMISMGMRVDGLLKLFGITMEKLVGLKGNPIVQMTDNNIIMNPNKMLPPPEMSQKVTQVEIVGDKLWMTLEDGFNSIEPDLPVKDPFSFVHIEGGVTLSGTLLLKKTNMTFLPITGKKHVLDFHIVHHPKQLNVGLTNSNNSVLTLYIPDWSEMSKHLDDPNWRAYPGNTGGIEDGSGNLRPASSLRANNR